MPEKIYILENLGCANCASKIERRIGELEGVEAVSITFATRQLRLTAVDPDALIPTVQSIANSLEPDILVKPSNRHQSSACHTHHEHCHEHTACCSCGDEHHVHTHACDETCDCGHEHHKHHAHAADHSCATCDDHHMHGNEAGERRELTEIIAGAILFLAGILFEHMEVGFLGVSAGLPVFLLAYILLGAKILQTALKNLIRGQVFDENFLMSVATLGAFVIREYPEAVGVMLFYRIGQFFEHKAVERSRSQIMEAADLRPEVVHRISGDEVTVVPAEQAQIGDLLLVRPGDRIPLDGVIIEGESWLDTAPITGESIPVRVVQGDQILSGCINTSGKLIMRVEKTLEESMVAHILAAVETAVAGKPKIDRFITRFARIYTPVVVALAAATAVIPSLLTGEWGYWIYTALSFLVMSCPCALVLSVPLTFFSGIGAASRKGILFKGGVSIEQMCGIKAVAMDKTGTITWGNFTLQQVEPVGGIEADGLLALCAGCEQHSGHPIAQSIVAAARERGLFLKEPEFLEEVAGYGIRAALDGKQVLCGNRELMKKFGVICQESNGNDYGTDVLVAVDGRYVGRLLLADTIKADARTAVAQLRKQGIATAMLTGDKQSTSQAVAAEAGVDELYAGLRPHEKLERLQEIRGRHGAVMFVGDGINDAPVLAGADVGAAMGSGADAAIEAADVVFMASAMEAIPRALAIARRTNRIARQNVVFALTIKVLVMLLGLFGYASMWMAVFADSGVAMLCVLNAVRILYQKK